MEIWQSGTITLEVLRQPEASELLEFIPLADSQTANTTQQVIGGGIDKSQDMECALRDLSKYDTEINTFKPWENNGTRQEMWDHCLRFQCNTNATQCDNNDATNFDGADPPCCVHILRDMAREFDRAMCYLGLEYFPAYGMLLGLTRADRLIPWTIDNDYMVSEETIMALHDLWSSASHLEHGLGFHYDLVYRLCVTPSFAYGRLRRWKVNETSSWYANSVYPFADLFYGHVANETMFVDRRQCYHDVTALRPTVRMPVYNGSFSLQFPRHREEVVSNVFGLKWRTPDAKKKSHGGTHCGRQQGARQIRRARKSARERQRNALSEVN